MHATSSECEFTHLFQSFEECPLADDVKVATPSLISSSKASTKYLLGTIQLEATLSTSPTYICKDSKGTLFAVTVKLPANEVDENVRGGGFDVTAWKRGWCLAIPGAKRSGVENGKQGFIVVSKAEVTAFPTSLERVVHISQDFNYQSVLHPEQRTCRACCLGGIPDKLKACSGCGVTWYCQKECQIRGWNEMGHKRECKIFMVLKKLTSISHSVP